MKRQTKYLHHPFLLLPPTFLFSISLSSSSYFSLPQIYRHRITKTNLFMWTKCNKYKRNNQIFRISRSIQNEWNVIQFLDRNTKFLTIEKCKTRNGTNFNYWYYSSCCFFKNNAKNSAIAWEFNDLPKNHLCSLIVIHTQPHTLISIY